MASNLNRNLGEDESLASRFSGLATKCLAATVKRSVLGQRPALSMKGKSGPMDEARIERRASVIPVAIDARRRRFPDEAPFRYRPFAGREDQFRLDDATYDRVIRDYNLFDLSI